MENCGWTNWRDANGSASGVRVQGTFLSGWIWSENLGWFTVGDGTPANGTAYENTTGVDFGVNVAVAGDLVGLAWSENAGWINFGPLASLGSTYRARLDVAASRFRGYAWSENVGWLNLDDSEWFVGTCAADFNADGNVDDADFQYFTVAYDELLCPSSPHPYFPNQPDSCPADLNGDEVVNDDDFVLFAEAYNQVVCQ
ncbi:MAG TPA: hypothetical protein VF777_09990 [Phycisphaerales bacterium]